jgi:hypothetical protein
MSELHAWQRGLQRPLVRCKLLLVRSIHFGGGFFLPSPLCTVRSTSRWSTEVSISSPPSSFRSLLCQPFVLSWWLHPLDAVRGGLGRERLDTPLTQTSYTARKAQRTIHGEMYAKGNDAPSDSLTMFSIHRWCTVCTFSQRESAQLFLFLPMPLGSELSPVTVPSVTLDPPADHLCVFSFLPLQKEKRQEKKRASGWLWGGLLAGSDFGNVSCCTHYVWSRVRF